MKKLTLFLLITISFSYYTTLSAAISVKFFVGDASIKQLGSEDWNKIKMNQKIQVGDTIKTASKAYVELDMNGNMMKINENSQVALGQDIDNEKKIKSLNMDYGNLQLKMNKLKKGGNGFKVNSVSSVCAVRGTEFAVLTGFDGTTVLQVQEGKVAFTGKENTVQVNANQESTIPLGGDPSAVVNIKKKEWNKWLAQSKNNLKGNEINILNECLVKIQTLESDIVKLEQLRVQNQEEKVKYDKLANDAKKAGNNDEFKENAAKAYKAAQYAYLSLYKIYLKANKMDLVKNLSDRTYLSVDKSKRTGDIQQTYDQINSIYQKYYDKYIKETIETRRKYLERKKKKNK